jgi:fatty-acyl-CoA synthase
MYVYSAIVAGPDDKWGERPVAFVVLKKNRTLNEITVIEHCRSSLAGYKVNVYLIFYKNGFNTIISTL